MSGFDLVRSGISWQPAPAGDNQGAFETLLGAQNAADRLNRSTRGPAFAMTPPARPALRSVWVVDALRILAAHTDGIIGLQFDQPGTDPEPLGGYLFRPADPRTSGKLRRYLAFAVTIEACCEHALSQLSPAELSAAMLKAGVS